MSDLEKRVAELELRQSAMEEHFELEWYDVPGHERYIEKGDYKR